MVFGLGMLYRNFMHILQKEMLSDIKQTKKSFHVGFSRGEGAVVLAPRVTLLQRWHRPTSPLSQV